MSVAHGGQVVISQLTEQLVRDSVGPEVELVDLGEHRLRDLAAPMYVFQVTHRELGHVFPALRSLDVASGNLPAQLSSFVGRARDLERLRELVVSRRLLTLTGVGGVGKTRLALQAAIDVQPRFPGGAWLAELARTGDPDAVGSVVVGALAAAPTPNGAAVDAVCDHLGATRSILVLDNCEHVVDAAADLASAVLARCPNVVVIATSREPLDVEGEQVVPVRPLDAQTDAVSLFVERAQSVDPEFVLDGASRDAVEEICARLDGVPLAIELAAARVDTMAAADIAARLDDRFRLLASGRRRSVDRHQTLRATLEWSHQLLGDDEQRLLRRLGVFAGGFTADAARDRVRRRRRAGVAGAQVVGAVRARTAARAVPPARDGAGLRVGAARGRRRGRGGRWRARGVDGGHRGPSGRGLVRRGTGRPGDARRRARQLA